MVPQIKQYILVNTFDQNKDWLAEKSPTRLQPMAIQRQSVAEELAIARWMVTDHSDRHKYDQLRKGRRLITKFMQKKRNPY